MSQDLGLEGAAEPHLHHSESPGSHVTRQVTCDCRISGFFLHRLRFLQWNISTGRKLMWNHRHEIQTKHRNIQQTFKTWISSSKSTAGLRSGPSFLIYICTVWTLVLVWILQSDQSVLCKPRSLWGSDLHQWWLWWLGREEPVACTSSSSSVISSQALCSSILLDWTLWIKLKKSSWPSGTDPTISSRFGRGHLWSSILSDCRERERQAVRPVNPE